MTPVDIGNGDWRDAALDRFRNWLYGLPDEAAEATGTDDRIEEDGSADLFRLFGAMSALRQEIKLQSKNLQVTGHKLESLADTLKDDLKTEFALLRNSPPTAGAEPGDSPRQSVLMELIAVRDGITQALSSAEVYRIPPDKLPRQPWLRKPHLGVEAMFQTLSRLIRKVDDIFYRLGVSPMVETGMRFDPERMRAVSVSSDGDAPSGAVTAVVRQGYIQYDRILQLPEVQVEK